MGWLDWLRPKKNSAATADDAGLDKAAGWDAITEVFLSLYPGQTNPPHRAPTIHRRFVLGDNAPALDGISAYDGGTYWHMIGFGLTELYGPEPDYYGKPAGDPGSGFGYELTFMLEKLEEHGDKPPMWAFDVIEGIARAVWQGSNFAMWHTIKTGPIDGQHAQLNALWVVPEPAYNHPISTPHGTVQLLRLVGVTNAFRERVLAAYDLAGGEGAWYQALLTELQSDNPLLVARVS